MCRRWADQRLARATERAMAESCECQPGTLDAPGAAPGAELSGRVLFKSLRSGPQCTVRPAHRGRAADDERVVFVAHLSADNGGGDRSHLAAPESRQRYQLPFRAA